jgi:hypothetical protein
MMAQVLAAAVLIFFYGILWHDRSAHKEVEASRYGRE